MPGLQSCDIADLQPFDKQPTFQGKVTYTWTSFILLLYKTDPVYEAFH